MVLIHPKVVSEWDFWSINSYFVSFFNMFPNFILEKTMGKINQTTEPPTKNQPKNGTCHFGPANGITISQTKPPSFLTSGPHWVCLRTVLCLGAAGVSNLGDGRGWANLEQRSQNIWEETPSKIGGELLVVEIYCFSLIFLEIKTMQLAGFQHIVYFGI